MSTLNVSNITDGTTTVGTSYVVNGSAKAWVNFNGTGTIAARDSFNLSSLTDNGTGDYTHNFSSAMTNSNFSTATDGRYDATVSYTHLASKGPIAYTTSSLQIATGAGNGVANYDFTFASSSIFGELA